MVHLWHILQGIFIFISPKSLLLNEISGLFLSTLIFPTVHVKN